MNSENVVLERRQECNPRQNYKVKVFDQNILIQDFIASLNGIDSR